MSTSLLLVNFGGPRSLVEVEPFLRELLCDRDVVRSRFWHPLHRLLFTRVARKRARRIREDYETIGGCSPIFADTEQMASMLAEKVGKKVLTFHRYLPSTHAHFLEQVKQERGELLVLPLFPQFSYATTGSIARWMINYLGSKEAKKLRWISSYAQLDSFTDLFAGQIRSVLDGKGLKEEETLLLFSTHGLPLSFVQEGDPYELHCQRSFRAIASRFPRAEARLTYQSRFGPEEWLRPYTDDFCRQLTSQRKAVLVIPLSFTSDHIETLFEVEQLYLPLLRARGYQAERCPAFGCQPDWIELLAQLVTTPPLLLPTSSLIRRGGRAL